MMEFQQVTAGYHGAPVLRDVTFTVPTGSITAVIGPNGSGKTTLLRAAMRRLPLQAGRITLQDRPVQSYERRAFARAVAFMPQVREVPAITVRALVSHGRFPYLGMTRQLRAADREAVDRALEVTGTAAWQERDLRELSGGERQRVYLAMALAQDTGLILLDEPTTYLDLGSQFTLLELVQTLNRQGKTIVMVLHDLGLALQYSTRVALLDKGRLAACDTPQALYHSGRIETVFGVQPHHDGASYWFTPLRTGRGQAAP